MDHPPYRQVPDADTLGTRHVYEMIRDYPFPTTTRELRDRVAKWRVPVIRDETVPMAELLDGVKDRSFRNAQGVVRAIKRAHPEFAE